MLTIAQLSCNEAELCALVVIVNCRLSILILLCYNSQRPKLANYDYFFKLLLFNDNNDVLSLLTV